MTDSCKGVLLVVDDEPLKRVTLQIELSEAGYTVFEAPDAMAGLKVIQGRPVDVVVTDVRMPEVSGMEFLEQLKAESPQTHVILMTGYGSVDAAVEAIKRGAYDYVTKPFRTEVLVEKIDRLLAARSTGNGDGEHAPEVLGSLVGQSYAARRLFEQIRAVADNERTVLIQGEAGMCSERVAETVHQLSRRSSGPLVRFSCAGSSPEILAAELFGPQGILDQAAGGTLFLDNVDALPIEFQARLLQTLEQADAPSSGGDGNGSSRARLICATQENLRQLVDAGRFREDLYYRLEAIRLSIPPLRERCEDIPVLVSHFLQQRAGERESAPRRVSAHAMDLLMSYHWPGNVRELEHVIERASAFASGEEVQPRDILLPADAGDAEMESAVAAETASGLTETVAGVERSLIDAALRKAAGNQAKAAQFLGIPRTTLRDKMAKYGMVGRAPEKELMP